MYGRTKTWYGVLSAGGIRYAVQAAADAGVRLRFPSTTAAGGLS